MRRFILKCVFVLSLIYLVNLFIGYLIRLDGRVKAEYGIYYPPVRWEEFYAEEPYNIDVIFLGASLCNKAYNPEVFDEITGLKSFNMGSSIQTIATSYFILNEILESQQPRVVFLDVFTRTLNYPGQIEGVRYNLNNMKFGRNWLNLYRKGLTFEEKIEYAFPAYSMRDQLNRFVKYPTNHIDTSEITDLYNNKGYIASTARISESKLEELSSTPFQWHVNYRTDYNFHYLMKIISTCEKQSIDLILVNAPLPAFLYENLDMSDYEEMLSKVSSENQLDYLNFNTGNLPLIDTIHFKDQHLNQWGAEITTQYLAEYYIDKYE